LGYGGGMTVLRSILLFALAALEAAVENLLTDP
jgi:hypothetical protein